MPLFPVFDMVARVRKDELDVELLPERVLGGAEDLELVVGIDPCQNADPRAPSGRMSSRVLLKAPKPSTRGS